MSFIAKVIDQLSLGEPQSFQNLTLYPLLSSVEACPSYLTLDEALAAGVAEVSEVSERGSVPELRFMNFDAKPILLVDGEELVGAKQNRVLNLSILAPAGESIVIPVSCVEMGRWSYRTNRFQSSERMHFARGRAEKVEQVSCSMRHSSTRNADQSQVWESIAAKEMVMNFHSKTSAMSDLYGNFSDRLDEFVKEFRPLPNQVGAVFALGGEIVGMDVFDSPITFAKLVSKFIRSYGLDAIEDEVARHHHENSEAETLIPGLLGEGEVATGRRRRKRSHKGMPSGRVDPPAKADVMNWLEGLIKARAKEFKAVGLGEDIRLEGEGYFGAALLAKDKAVHLCAFSANH